MVASVVRNLNNPGSKNNKMKRIVAAILLMSFVLPLCAQFRTDYSDLDDSESVTTLKSHVSYIASAAMNGRKAGSEEEKETAEYVWQCLNDYGLEMLTGRSGDVFGMEWQPGDTVTSRNVIAAVQGYDPKLRDRYIVVGARMDNLGTNVMTVDGEKTEQIYYGANGNASGLAMMMELARMVNTNSVLFRRSIIFVAFGASRTGFAGSWYFINRSFGEADKIDAMIDLDMLGSGDEFLAYTSSNQDMNMLLGSMDNQLLPVKPRITASEPYPSDHRSFYASSIPSVMFTTGVYAEHDSPRDTPSILDYEAMEREMEYLYAFVRTIANETVTPSFRGDAYSSKKTDDRAYAYYDCEVKPSFMGHSDPKWFMTNWVYKYLRYPKEAIENGIQGRVNVTFTVEKDGKVSDVTIAKSLDALLDEEAIRAVKSSPKWKPAMVDGIVVRSYITIPVDFVLEKRSKKKMSIKK